MQVARLEDPDGAGQEPYLLVGGSAEGRGVVTSASYETRSFGVRSGMPTARALALCPGARVVPVSRGACGARSRAVRTVLERFTPIVEAASIDEAYLDLTGTEAVHGGAGLAELALRIQAAVRAEAEIVVSIGGGTSKTIAKLASRPAKPGGVYIVEAGHERDFMSGLTLADLPGVGPVFADELRAKGLVRIEHALGLGRAELVRILGGRGSWLHDRMRGIDGADVTVDRASRSVSRDQTFARDIDDATALERALLALTIRLGADLRDDGLRARTLTVRLRDAQDFRTRQASHTLAEPIASDRALYAQAKPLLARLRAARRVPARLIGVAASNLTAGDVARQTDLFGEDPALAPETERDRALSALRDRIRARFGEDAIRPGGLLHRDSALENG